MSQARYAAESAVQKASNFLLDPSQYQVPGTGGADVLSNYNRTVSPVTYNGNPVVLSAISSQASNYPITAVQTAFNTAAQGTLTAGNATLTYGAAATLLSMQLFDSYGGGQAVVQTWQITGDGTLSGARNATVEVLSLVETPKVPASSYAAFATDNTCASLNFAGNTTVNSYDSTSMTGSTAPTMSSTGGNVGTNGNLTIGGSVDVQGNLYTPRAGVGDCTGSAVDALTESGHATVEGSLVQLPTAVSYPTPPAPAPSPIAAQSLSTTTGACGALGLTAANCTISGSNIVIDGHGTTLTLPGVQMQAHVNIVLVAGQPPAQYNFNSISLAGGSTIGVQATSPSQSALVEISGQNPDGSAIATPVDLTGGSYASVTGCSSCSNFDASMLQFIYDGTGEFKFSGNNGSAATVYAPNAALTITGTADVYGSVLGKRIDNQGSGNIHYDRRLQHDFYVAGHPMLNTFSWKRY
jgi:hypothetical protein